MRLSPFLPPLGSKKNLLIFNIKNMLKFVFFVLNFNDKNYAKT